MKIIVGLGNPGKEYERTKHNVGFLFLDYMAKKYSDLEIQKKTSESLIGETKINSEKVIFVKPQTYMNLSGNAVQKIKKFYKVENKDIIIIYDDLDIPFGTIRYREKGSGGTHNGMKNIIQCLNTQELQRIRIGIGGLKHENEELKNFVLSRFSNNQLEELEKVFETVEKKLNECIK